MTSGLPPLCRRVVLGAALMAASTAHARTLPPSDRRVEAPRRVSESQRLGVPFVEVIDSEVLRDRGARDIGDALQILPGIQVVDLADGRRRLVMDGWVARAIFLVNERPVQRGPDGEIDLGELPVSVDEILRIEVIRRPMSHVYGSQAEGGVINIVTRRLQESGAGATAMARGFESGRLGGQFSAGASYAGEKGGVYASGVVMGSPETQSQGVPAFHRRNLGLLVGGAFRLHPRVLARGDSEIREFAYDAPLGAQRTLRTAVNGEVVVNLGSGDRLYLEMRAAGVDARQRFGAQRRDARVYEQGAWARYLGQPIGGHFVLGEVGLLGEFAGSGPGMFDTQRFRGTAMLADTWEVSTRFALEAAFRIESSESFMPALAPSLSFRYEPFLHLFVRASVAAGYRYPGLLTRPDPWPTPITGKPLEPGAHDNARAARFMVSYEPDASTSLNVEVFRTDFSSGPLTFQTGAGAVGVYFSENPLAVDAHVQGLRAHWALTRLPGALALFVGYEFLQEARSDLTGQRLPFAPVHHGNLRVQWNPEWLGAGLELGVQALVDRVDAAGRALPDQAVLQGSIRKSLGPLQVVLAVDDATRVVEPQGGPRGGRSLRLLVRAASW